MPDEFEEGKDKYVDYDAVDRKGMQAEGAADVLTVIERALGPDEYKQLQDRIAEGALDPSRFQPKSEWSVETWRRKWADGTARWAELSDEAKVEMDLH